MKAAVRSQYGPPEFLSVKEIAIPEPKEDELLIRVHAATVNRTDCGILWGKPFIIRFFTGLKNPKLSITGTDFAGVVEKAGANVTGFKAGDRVWGFDDNGITSHAEYMVINSCKAVQKIPGSISFAEAAASAEGAHYAFNFLNKVELKPGDKVMVNGATGAIGSAAVQFLKYNGAYITATCRTANIELVKSLGADKIIDYTKVDFTKDDEKYNFVFDSVGKSSFGKCKNILTEKGVYISSELGPYSQNPFLALISPLSKGKKVKFPIPLDTKRSLNFISKLIEEGKFKPVIDRTYPLEKIPDAYDYAASGEKIGNVVIKLNNN